MSTRSKGNLRPFPLILDSLFTWGVLGMLLALLAGLFAEGSSFYLHVVWDLLSFDPKFLLIGLAWLPVFLICNHVGNLLLKKCGISIDSGISFARRLTILDCLLLAAATGFGEEFFFRGILQQWFGAGTFSLFFAATLFGGIHYFNSHSTAYVGFTFVVGLGFGLLLLTYGSLWVPITVHIGNNLAAFLLKRAKQAKEASTPVVSATADNGIASDSSSDNRPESDVETEELCKIVCPNCPLLGTVHPRENPCEVCPLSKQRTY